MSIIKFCENKKLKATLWLYIMVVIGITLQLFLPSLSHTKEYTNYNNYVIFKNSFFHLIHNQDLYLYYNKEQFDLYKYSPSFSLFFGILANLPDLIGLFLWSLINALSLFYAIKLLGGITEKNKSFILLFFLLELINSIQNSQSNALMAGLIILSFALLEKTNYLWAAFCIVFSIYIKLFGVVALALYLFYPDKIKLTAYTIFWTLIFAILPLCVISPKQLIFLYQSWLGLLKDDHSASMGISAMGIVNSWLHVNIPKNIIVLAGAALFCAPLIKIKLYKDFYFRLQMLASVLLWIILFNHKAESPTFIIAMAGIGIWYFSQQKNKINTILIIASFIFVSLSVSDLVPSHIKRQLIEPYSIKALLPLIIWLKLIFDLMTERYKPLISKQQE